MLSRYENEQVLLLEMRADACFDPGNGTSFYSIKNQYYYFKVADYNPATFLFYHEGK
jgi:hypothetical protein